jgi:hypothetical protein
MFQHFSSVAQGIQWSRADAACGCAGADLRKASAVPTAAAIGPGSGRHAAPRSPTPTVPHLSRRQLQAVRVTTHSGLTPPTQPLASMTRAALVSLTYPFASAGASSKLLQAQDSEPADSEPADSEPAAAAASLVLWDHRRRRLNSGQPAAPLQPTA